MIESHEKLDNLLKGEKYQEPELGAKTKDPAGCSCSGWRHLFKRSQKNGCSGRNATKAKKIGTKDTVAMWCQLCLTTPAPKSYSALSPISSVPTPVPHSSFVSIIYGRLGCRRDIAFEEVTQKV